MSHMDNGLYEALMKGYAEMSEINRELSEEAVYSDNEALRIYEEDLTECE